MNKSRTTPNWNTASIALGFVAWVVGVIVFASSQATYFDQIKLLIFFGIAVIAPLALALVAPDTGRQAGIYRTAVYFQPIAAILSGLSLLMPIGSTAGSLAASWLVLTVMMALLGLSRLPASRSSLAAMCITMGLLYSPISGVWLVIHQTWGAFLTFDSTIVLLTAAHFCYISLGALLIAGLIGRRLTRAHTIYRVAAFGAIVSPAIVAAGITLTSFLGGVSPVEIVGVVALAGSVLLLSVLILSVVRVDVRNRMARWLITASAASLFLTMGLALAYSIGRATHWWGIAIPDMVQWHGWFNAIGFTFLALLGWRVEFFSHLIYAKDES